LKKIIIISLFNTILFCFAPDYIHALEDENTLLRDITANIGNYKTKIITLRLKLKNLDNVFKKIIFYDKKNHDIEFDINKYKDDAEFQKSMLNLHQGMEYLVTFRVIDVSSLGPIMGELNKFIPVALINLPERDRNILKK